jgi:uncharacterized protein (TIGR00255 family)
MIRDGAPKRCECSRFCAMPAVTSGRCDAQKRGNTVAMSMTAYARASEQTDIGAVTWELRSVNNRYLDANVRAPEEFRALDAGIRERLSKRIRRGKVDCTLKIGASTTVDADLAVNMELVEKLAKACKQINGALHDGGPVSALDILRWPGVLETATLDVEHAGTIVMKVLEATLDDFLDSRQREGSKLVDMVAQRCDGIEAIIVQVRGLMPDIVLANKTRIESRLEDVRAELDPGRLEAEMVVFCQKTDVAEELDRLEAHIEEVRRVLKLREPIGRRLDFLMQELNREANTLGSKSVDTRSTSASVDLKVLIEQMREQIQNLE